MALRINPGNETIEAFGTASAIGVSIQPKSTGLVTLDELTFPKDGSPNQILETDGAGGLSFVSPSAGAQTGFKIDEPVTVEPTATTTDALAIGDGADATAVRAISIGQNSAASFLDTIAIGTSAVASTGDEAIAIGGTAAATAQRALAIGGGGVIANAIDTVAIGPSAGAKAQNAVAIGVDSDASATGCVAVGSDAITAHVNGIALGMSAKTSNPGEFAIGGNDQLPNVGTGSGVFTLFVQTTDATQTTMLVGTSNFLGIPDDSTWLFEVIIGARRTDADNESAGYKLEFVIDRNAGVTALVGGVAETIYGEDTVAWSVTASADDTNDRALIQVTGEAAKTIRWCGQARFTKLNG